MVIFGRLFEAFTHLDNIKHAREVCSEEKASAVPASNPMTRREAKLKCSIPFES